MDFFFVYPIPRYKTRMKLAGLELIQPPKCYMSLRTLQSICVRKIHMYGLGEDGEMTALATGDDRLIMASAIKSWEKSIIFRYGLPEDFLSKGQNPPWLKGLI